MSALKIIFFFFFIAPTVFADCLELPKTFKKTKVNKALHSFINDDKTVSLTFSCDKSVTREVAVESLDFYSKAIKLKENTYFFDLKSEETGFARLYTHWSADKGLVQVAVIGKNKSPEVLKIAEWVESQL